MECCDLRQTTAVNGFDVMDRDNAMQNNYAWSMAEFGGYIYVGTGRNIVYTTMAGLGLSVPPELTPQNPSNEAEIWRYPVCGGRWERVYRAAAGSGVMGFRYMITYRGEDGVEALYCATFGVFTQASLLMTTDGVTFVEVGAGIPAGFSTRCMAVHGGLLYSGATNALGFSEESLLFVTDRPQAGWDQVDFGAGRTPTGEVVSMISFNGYLYIGTSPEGGFEVWKSRTPWCGGWTLVCDRGAGDALNEVPMSMAVFRGALYVGSGIWVGIQSVDPHKTIVPPKGFDVIRIDRDDRWKVVVGSEPIAPTRPTTGVRNRARYPSGFGSIFNAYCWSMCVFQSQLLIGSWDSAVLIHSILSHIGQGDAGGADGAAMLAEGFSEEDARQMLRTLRVEFKPEYDWGRWLAALRKSLPKYPAEFGFDLWASGKGRSFRAVTLKGLCNMRNYGLRTMVVTADRRHVFLGTANPFQGCEVWEGRG